MAWRALSSAEGGTAARHFQVGFADGKEVLRGVKCVSDVLAYFSALERCGLITDYSSGQLSKLTTSSELVDAENSVAQELFRSMWSVLGVSLAKRNYPHIRIPRHLGSAGI